MRDAGFSFSIWPVEDGRETRALMHLGGPFVLSMLNQMEANMKTRKKGGTVSIMPDWTGTLGMLLAILEAGNAEGRAAARAELYRMAKAADLYNAGKVRP